MAAIDVLRDGGNAVDAAIAASAVLCIAEPHMTGIGGDCFVLYSPKGGLPIALNGSGRAPAAATLDWYLERGFNDIPERSPHAVTVPGAVDAWFRLLADHGTRDMAELLAPAIRLAEEGCPVTPRVAFDFSGSWRQIAEDPVAAAIFMPDGVPLGFGERMRQPLLAATLRRIARGRPARLLRGTGRGGHRRPAARSRRPAHARRFRRAERRLRAAHLDRLRRIIRSTSARPTDRASSR